MATNTTELTFKVTLSWWFKWYVYSLIIFAKMTNSYPDEDKLKKIIEKAVKVELL